MKVNTCICSWKNTYWKKIYLCKYVLWKKIYVHNQILALRIYIYISSVM